MRDRLRLTAPIQSIKVLDTQGGSTLDAVIRSQREAAYAEGLQAAGAQGLQAAAERLEQATEALQAQQEAAEAELGTTAVQLATEIARSILKREQLAGNYDIEAIVREALHESGVGRNPCSVHLNPQDHEELKDLSWRAGTRLEADEGIAPGDVQVETGLGLLVRDAMGALETIKQSLLEEAA